MGCLKSLAKYIVFIFNFIIVLAALAFIIVGVIFKLELDKEVFQDNDNLKDLALAPILLIVVGCIIFFIAFLGCCGAIKKNVCMLNTYGIILIIILALQLALAIFAFVQLKNNENFKREVFDAMKKALKKYDKEAIKEYIDTIQTELKCCGVDGPADWLSAGYPVPPKSCFNGLVPYAQGCGPKVYDSLEKNVNIVGIIAAVICGIELLGAILAFWVASGHKRGMYA